MKIQNVPERPFPFSEFPEKGSEWKEVQSKYDELVNWICVWSGKIPDRSESDLRKILGLPPA